MPAIQIALTKAVRIAGMARSYIGTTTLFKSCPLALYFRSNGLIGSDSGTSAGDMSLPDTKFAANANSSAKTRQFVRISTLPPNCRRSPNTGCACQRR